MAGYRKDDYNWRYDTDELPEDVIRASSALENLQLDRKARNLTSSWRLVLITIHIYFLGKGGGGFITDSILLLALNIIFIFLADMLVTQIVRMMAGLITCNDDITHITATVFCVVLRITSLFQYC